jgi:hypothetical protein
MNRLERRWPSEGRRGGVQASMVEGAQIFQNNQKAAPLIGVVSDGPG